jgi:hypothetical protein
LRNIYASLNIARMSGDKSNDPITDDGVGMMDRQSGSKEMTDKEMTGMKGLIPESWHCIDCGANTAPGLLNRAEMEIAAAALGAAWDDGKGITQTINSDSEVYTVRSAVWSKAGMEPMGGCLCISCLEKRLGRTLKPKDFLPDHPFNSIPGSARLMQRQKR